MFKKVNGILPTKRSLIDDFFRDGTWNWDTTGACVYQNIDTKKCRIVFGCKPEGRKMYPHYSEFDFIEMMHDQNMNSLGYYKFIDTIDSNEEFEQYASDRRTACAVFK